MVIKNEINIKPIKISKKKLFFIFKLAKLPQPDTDNERKKILKENRSICTKIIIYL